MVMLPKKMSASTEGVNSRTRGPKENGIFNDLYKSSFI
jgi:hypothetical protein